MRRGGVTEGAERDAEDEKGDGVGDAGAAEEVAGGDAQHQRHPDEEHRVVGRGLTHLPSSLLPLDWIGSALLLLPPFSASPLDGMALDGMEDGMAEEERLQQLNREVAAAGGHKTETEQQQPPPPPGNLCHAHCSALPVAFGRFPCLHRSCKQNRELDETPSELGPPATEKLKLLSRLLFSSLLTAACSSLVYGKSYYCY